ncbi:tetratricopeptide repeat protein [Maribacter sp. 2-571]|uniref:tetratricopeptide repeat protein n=1 Tax=Maribacter sp. 2-571 TaxID=3417569 RepID=UPI003D33BF26
MNSKRPIAAQRYPIDGFFRSEKPGHVRIRSYLTYFFFVASFVVAAQDNEEQERLEALKESKNLTWTGNKNLSENNYVEAEVAYRKAISKSDKNVAAPFNLGNAHYNNATYSEAFGRFKEAGETADQKDQKHKAYHNMGNVFMKRKEYQKAVEAYKEALRNDPKDEETRYNLALAKEMLKKEEQENKNDQNKDSKDQNEDKDQKDKDKKDGDNKEDKQDQNKEGDEGDKKEDDKKDDKEGEGKDKEQQQKKPNENGDNEQKPQQRRPNQLSKQQIQNLLDAMQQEEKKVQEKIDAKKVKGVKVKNEKDW